MRLRRTGVVTMTVGVLMLAGTLVSMSARAQTPASGAREVLNDVHTDAIDVQFFDGRLTLQTRIGQPPFRFAPADEVIFQLKDNASSALTVPDDPLFAFLGSPGDPIWLAPQTQDFSLIFAGWDTESIPTGVLAGDVLDLDLVSVTGPGRVEVFQDGEFGEPIRVFSSTDTAFKTLRQPVRAHAHANWVFSALGRYELTVRVRATAAGGMALPPATVTYTWFVGGQTASDVVAVSTSTALSVAPQNPSAGQSLTLTSTVQPSRAVGWVEFLDGATVLGFSPVTDGTAGLTTTPAAGSHTLAARFVPRFDNDYAASTSAPVTVVVSGPPESPSPSPSPSQSPTMSPSPSPSAVSPSPSSSIPTPSSPSTTSSAPCIPTNFSVPILDNGHVDVATRISNGKLNIFIKDGTKAGEAVWRDPADVVLHVKSQAAVSVPTGGEFGFLGQAGTTIWQIPQTQRDGILWLGWNTESISGSAVSWSLAKVSGPGNLAVYEYSSFGQPQVIFNSGDGLSDHYDIPAGTHAHGNWAFTRQGVYRLTFVQQAQSLRDTAVVTVVVGNVDPRPYAKRSEGCGLARTGEAISGYLALGVLLVLGGVIFVALSQRRRRQTG